MYRSAVLIGAVIVFCATFGWGTYCDATGIRYTLYGRGKVVGVPTPNLLQVRMLDHPTVVTVRLLGVGSPRNRQRFYKIQPEIRQYIKQHDMWEKSRSYVRDLVEDRVVEVWTRRWNPLDEKNRLLAYLKLPAEDDPVDVNARIIKKGLGFVTRDYVHVTFAQYRDLEQWARSERRGMWRALSQVRPRER